MSARSSGMADGGWAFSFAKLVTAERRSRLRLSESSTSPASRSRTVCSVAGPAGWGGGLGVVYLFSGPRGPGRTRTARG